MCKLPADVSNWTARTESLQHVLDTCGLLERVASDKLSMYGNNGKFWDNNETGKEPLEPVAPVFSAIYWEVRATPPWDEKTETFDEKTERTRSLS